MGVGEVERITTLAKIELPIEKRTKYSRQLDEILGYVSTVNKLISDKAKPHSSSMPSRAISNVCREDRISGTDCTVEDLLANVPELEGTNIKVPAVLGDDNG